MTDLQVSWLESKLCPSDVRFPSFSEGEGSPGPGSGLLLISHMAFSNSGLYVCLVHSRGSSVGPWQPQGLQENREHALWGLETKFTVSDIFLQMWIWRSRKLGAQRSEERWPGWRGSFSWPVLNNPFSSTHFWVLLEIHCHLPWVQGPSTDQSELRIYTTTKEGEQSVCFGRAKACGSLEFIVYVSPGVWKSLQVKVMLREGNWNSWQQVPGERIAKALKNAWARKIQDILVLSLSKWPAIKARLKQKLSISNISSMKLWE